jgi:hypothetical protein
VSSARTQYVRVVVVWAAVLGALYLLQEYFT